MYSQMEKIDILSDDSIAPHLSGCDAVLSCLGYAGKAFSGQVSFYGDTIKTIRCAMRSANITRFIGITTWCTQGKHCVYWFTVISVSYTSLKVN